MPDGLVERIQFEITLDALHAELATLTQLDLATSGARSASTESVRTVTFTAETVTTMVTISPQPDGSVRVDGWVAPGAGLLVEVLLADGRAARTPTTTAASWSRTCRPDWRSSPCTPPMPPARRTPW